MKTFPFLDGFYCNKCKGSICISCENEIITYYCSQKNCINHIGESFEIDSNDKNAKLPKPSFAVELKTNFTF